MHIMHSSAPVVSAEPNLASRQFFYIAEMRDLVFARLENKDLAACRLVCREFGVQAAPHLFQNLSVDFKSNTLSKPARMEALDRIGGHVQSVSFIMAHGPHTFLPPLLDPSSGEEIEFVYTPDCSIRRGAIDRLSIPKYGSWEMTELLVKQYPPLFHAATNVPAFIRTFAALPNLQHLKVSTPGQEGVQRYRRDIVDYALISLRIAIERTSLKQLRQLSLDAVHPAAIQHLNPMMGLGARPNSPARWRQIKELTIHMDTVFCSEKYGADHLKLLHAYFQVFSATLERLVFHWQGEKGLFPLALNAEQCLSFSSPAQACPKRCHLALRPLHFSKLVFMKVDNVTTDAAQLSTFILAHRRSISEFNFEGTTLREGTWDDALAPLTRLSSKRSRRRRAEVMDVPLMLSPLDLPAPAALPKPECIRPPPPPPCATPLISNFGFDPLDHIKLRGRGLLARRAEHVKQFLKSPFTAIRSF